MKPNKDSIVILYLTKTFVNLSEELASKHEDGEFLPHITKHHPHLHKTKEELLSSYCTLIIEIESICNIYSLSRKEARTKFKAWLQKLKHSRRMEHKLHFDACCIDIGGDH